MVLEETTRIEAPRERVFGFFQQMDEQRYLDWHPDHIAFRWVGGEEAAEGNVFYLEEHIRGKVNKQEMRYKREG